MGGAGGGVVTAEELIRAQYAIADSHGGVWLACACAAAVLRRTTPGETRPAETVRLAQRWACGEPISADELQVAARAAEVAVAVEAAETSWATTRTAAWSWTTARAAAWSAEAAAASARAASARAASASRASTQAVGAAEAVARCAVRFYPSIDFVALLRYEIESIEPTSADVGAARPGVAVIWDCYAVELGPARIGSLGDALSRARVLGLDWQHPVERALAERLPLEHAAWAALEVAS